MSTKIKSVEPRTPAHRARIRPGETLLEVNGHRIVDVLDYKFYTYDARLTLTLQGEGGSTRSVRVRKQEGEDLGLEFDTYLMDRARSCANNCIFCFVDQMPRGMRDTLYFKDDDARLSFLMGNYITLTNLSPREIQRIIDLRISPINVSVHTTDPALRCEMLGNRRAGESIEVMRRFAENGVCMNCQIVACPGINDGPALQRTLEDLTEMYPGVDSVSIVPVGVTKFREGLCPLKTYDKDSSAALIDQVEAWGAKCMERFGTTIFWCSDEFYLLAGRELPQDGYYEDYRQLENGVGMLRLLETEFRSAMEADAPPAPGSVAPFTIATGVSAAPTLETLVKLAAARCGGFDWRVVPIVNHFFGETIVVAGLVTGRDLIDQLRGKYLGERLLLPDNMLRCHENVFLDDVTIQEVEAALGVPLTFVEQDGGALWDAILGRGGQRRALEGAEKTPEEYYTYNPSHSKEVN